MARVNVYIDGFNFYYGAVKDTPYRWLDFGRFCRAVLPRDDINTIRYFTALVKPTPDDPAIQQRQQAFLRALGTVPDLTIHLGRFSQNVKRRPLAHTPPGRPLQMVDVLQREEKGSDVNLASHLLMDGFEQEYEVAVVVSNDSDLLEPIRLVRQRLGLRVGILNPYKRTAQDLLGEADFYRSVQERRYQKALASCQFPSTLTDATGTIHRPVGW